MTPAIKVENLSKAYQLGQIGTGTISRDLERWFARLRGKEDPFLKIGENNVQHTKSDNDVVWSLKDINFEIEQGDAVGIIGRNGAGKSTLLKILSKVTAPTNGKISGRGRISSLLEVGTGFHPELSGRENIFLNGAILGMRKKEIQRKLEEIVDFAGVERYLDTPVKRYSSGMYVRLAFAVAAHLESEILIVDEVLAVGDAEFQKKCLGKMSDVSKGEGRTVLFVSHNMDAVTSLCNTGLVLGNGSVIFLGETQNAIAHYEKRSKLGQVRKLSNHPLGKNLKLKQFEINKSQYRIFDDLDFKIIFEGDRENVYTSIALNIFDEADHKIAFIDLRRENIRKKMTAGDLFEISGKIMRLPLLPGNYSLTLHVESNLVFNDYFDLLQFNVVERDNIAGILPYPMHVRGRLQMECDFDYINFD
ncbi:lipopolysaccharide transport system ATP-binding protein [Pedobacter sp. UYEF25]